MDFYTPRIRDLNCRAMQMENDSMSIIRRRIKAGRLGTVRYSFNYESVPSSGKKQAMKPGGISKIASGLKSPSISEARWNES